MSADPMERTGWVTEDRGPPDMSVVIVTPDCYETIRTAIEYLQAQTARRQLEIVIVAPSTGALNLDTSAFEGFAGFRVVEVGPISSLASARAAGIRLAGAPVVVLLENHSYPEPGWAQVLIEAHRQPWAAVGPEIGNANPESMISWACLLLAYGRWIAPATAGEIDDLPGQHSAYKRSVLLDYGPALEAMLEAESVLHWDLRARGYRLYLEPAARTNHLNITLPVSHLREHFHYGRLFAAARARPWSRLRRFVYAGGAPLIPLLRILRILRQTRSGPHRDLFPGVLPALIIGLITASAGEMAGYALGTGNARKQMCEFEFYRERHLAGRQLSHGLSSRTKI